jgi:hypothetical protein
VDEPNDYWVEEAEIYDPIIRTDYLYKMEKDIFSSLQTANFLTNEDIACVTSFVNQIPFTSQTVSLYKYLFYVICK